MGHSPKFHKLAQTIGKPDERESQIAMSFRANESIIESLNSLARATGVSKNEILNQVLEIGLTEFCEALESRTDLVMEIRDDAYQVFEFFPPEHARRVRAKYGDAVQLDLEDAIEQQKQQEQKPKVPTKGK
jgi:predicted DNA-binding protein